MQISIHTDGNLPIAVSKLLCPICHLAFTSFKQTHLKHAPFSVRRRHSTVYAVDLPHCMPRNMQEDLLERLQAIVLQELQILLQKYYTRLLESSSPDSQESEISLSRTVSQESTSALSTNSQGAFAFNTWESYIPTGFMSEVSATLLCQ